MTRAYRRHPAEVTYDRLVDHSETYSDLLTGREKDALGEVCQALWEIANGERGRENITTEGDGS